MSKPMVDIAFDILKGTKESVGFQDLFKQVATERGFSESQANNKIAQFYSNLTTDNRFVRLDGNKWDIRSRHKFSDVVVKTDDIIADDDDESEE